MRLEVFGQFAVAHGLKRWESFPTARCRDIVAFLALARGDSIPRRWLAENVWTQSEPDACRNKLSVSLSIMRRMLDSDFDQLLQCDRHCLRLADGVENEFDEFWTAMGRFDGTECVVEKMATVRTLLECHRGPLFVDVRQAWARHARQDADKACRKALTWMASQTGDAGLAARAEIGCFTGIQLARAEGLEPPTPSSEDWCSIH